MKKKLTAVTLIATMMMSLLAGCGKKAEKSKETGNQVKVSTESVADMSTEEIKEYTEASPAEASKADASLEWWQKTTAYEVYVSSFNDSNGDGTGDLNGVTEKLDYLKELNVGAIWLTPVFASPMKDNGYDVADYYSINPLYGSMEDMDNLLAEAKKRNIRIVMDLVVNHTSDQCEWFQKSIKKEDKYADYYIWADAKEDGSAPNNWRSIFGGSAWQWNEERGQYYLHTFLTEQPDLNWANADVRDEVYKIGNYWVDKGIGGFRMDAIPYIKKPDLTVDGTPDSSDGMVDIHKMTVNTPGILDYLHEFRENVTNGHDVFTVGEANGVPSSDLVNWVGDDGVFNMIFQFDHFSNENLWYKRRHLSTLEFKSAINEDQSELPESGWYPAFLENHDEPRSVETFMAEGTDRIEGAKALATVLLTMKGTPFIYQGEELGMTNTTWPEGERDDANSTAQYNLAIENGLSEEEAQAAIDTFARDNARTPMQWDASENAGFTKGKPWIKMNPNYTEINAAAEEADENSVLKYYQTLTNLRASEEVLQRGSYEPILVEDENIFAFKREIEGKSMVILVNFSQDEVSYDSTLTEGYTLKLSSKNASQAESGTLAGIEARIYEK